MKRTKKQRIVKIKWEELQIGDIFDDGSRVVDISEVQEKPCYNIKYNGNSLVVSEDHLLKVMIFYNNIMINSKMKHSKIMREIVGESSSGESILWITAKDIFASKLLGARIYPVSTNANGSENILDLIIDIDIFANGEPQKCMCITTDTGEYEIFGLKNHNTARKLFYALADVQLYDDCGGPYIDALHCKRPEGNICKKCAKATQGGNVVDEVKYIGGWASTSISEALTQLSMKNAHIGVHDVEKQQHGSSIISATFDAWGTSPIIQKAREQKTAIEAREVLFNGLKEAYKNAGIKEDDFPLMIAAKKLTSFKRNAGGELVPCKDDEPCDIVSILSVGSYNNIFKKGELSSSYKTLTTPTEQEVDGSDAANKIIL